MANIKDVAKAAGVSIGTVSNVLNQSKPVNPELKERVLKAVAELNYQKDPAASILKSGKTRNIAVVFTSLAGIFFPEVLKGIQQEAREAGYSVSVYDSNEDAAYERELIPKIASSMVDGLILASFTNSEEDVNKEYWKSLSRLKGRADVLPVVSLEWCPKGFGGDAVVIDQQEAAKMATRHLIDQGHTKVGHISGPFVSEIARLRYLGYRQALEEAGLPWREGWLKQHPYAPLTGYNSMHEFIEEGEVTGVFCGNDQMAVGAIRAAKEHGVSIPEDMAVIGFDNLFAGTLISPSLSTVDVPRFRMGSTGMRLLLDRMEGTTTGKGKRVILPTRLVVRQSTDLRGDNTWDLFGW